MKTIFLHLFFCLFSFWALAQNNQGYFNFNYNQSDGSVTLEVPEDRGEFLYVNYLSSGLGSNDIGLDRGQIGDNRVVEFKKYGNKLFLVEKNLDYRAVSNNDNERQSVEEAFASSVLFAFPIKSSKGNVHTIDISSMLLSDSHNVVERLKSSKEGNYKLDKNRSAILPEFCKSFPENTEFRSMITFGGNPTGKHVRTVVPTPELITLRTHHSFVKLPDDNYQPRVFHPAAGYFMTSYKDYAVPIEEDMNQRFITRHRLEKNADGSTKEPIIYYIDRGCPEPIKSALMEGASWWNQAYEAAGFKDAFQVKELPEGADPLDVRYNMIQWVHRSTRGWSYGASVVDPRTGEILKGHVSLGSLRVRQDFMIMEALMSPYKEGADFSAINPMTEIALARLRQLSAHEVGHTIGLAHNFAASTNNRASVMDYPHPKLKWTGANIDFTDAYDDKIGEWDKRAIIYGYGIFENEVEGLQAAIKENKTKGLAYITDRDARPASGSNASAHLWDNGSDIIKELEDLYEIRNYALKKLGENTLREGMPYSELEKYIVPVFLLHRYQLEGTAKLIGGSHYSYDVKDGDNPQKFEKVPLEEQNRALDVILKTLDNDFNNILGNATLLLPNAPGYGKTRESVSGNMGPSFDINALISANSKHTLNLLLTPERLNRLTTTTHGFNELDLYLTTIQKRVFKTKNLILQEMYIEYLMTSYDSSKTYANTKHSIYDRLVAIQYSSNSAYLVNKIKLFLEGNYKGKYTFESVKIPPGSPIGCH